MFRIILGIAAILLALTACTDAPDSSSGNAGDTLPAADQKAGKQTIPVERIAGDLIGRVVPITEATGDGTPTDWTFDAGEFRQIEIVEMQMTESAATLVIFMTTRNNAGPKEDAVQVSGKLKLHYKRKGGRWQLIDIENRSFRYTVGLAI